MGFLAIALRCKIGEFDCVPPHNESKKNNYRSKLLVNNCYKISFRQLIFGKWLLVGGFNPSEKY